MKLDRGFFGSRVARRIFGSFVIASLVPIATTAILALLQVGRVLQTRAYEQLSATTRSVGQQVLDRLLIAEEALGYVATNRGGAHPIGIDAALLETQGRIEPLFGTLEPLADADAVAVDKPSVLVREHEGATEILLVKRIGENLAVGRVDPDYLWSSANLLSYGLDLCVFASQSGDQLYCSRPIPLSSAADVAAKVVDASQGEFEWDRDGEPELGVHWELFLPSRFVGVPWQIMISQPTELALESWIAFKRVFEQAFVLSVIVILLLSLQQVRRVLEPLDRLLAGAKRIGQGVFTTRIELDSADEFHALGDAMNEMTEQIGHQFDTLTALAEIDRLILASPDVERVLETTVERVGALVASDAVSVLLLDRDDPSRGKLYSRRAADGSHRIEISEELLAWLGDENAGPVRDHGSALSHLPALLVPEDGGRAAVLPMLIGTELRGALLALFTEPQQVDDDVAGVLGEFASRLCVAVAAADRDQELFDRAHFDALTGLPNRQLCMDRLGQAIAQARRDDHQLAVLFIDLDGFKNVNDSLGHSFGDELLRETALRLSGALRDTDTVARLGGDEYVVILPHVHGLLEVEAIVAKIMASFRRPFNVHGHESFVSASVGATMFPEDGATAEELLRKADTAMYGAKDSGRARYVFFAEEMDQRVQERLSMQNDLRNALGQGQFSLAYQPQVDFATGRLVGAEALLRWVHPVRGSVPPAIFVPILEETGLIDAVGTWVIEAALAEFARWRQLKLGIERVAVNIASRQLFDRGFVGLVDDAIRRVGVEGDSLELELTEHTVVSDFAHCNRVFRELGARGVRIAIDDFGTGYSSLGYLQELSFDALKIDRAFVAGIPNKKSMAIVQAVLTVAHALGKYVVAEGVESPLQAEQLAVLGCDIGQGYLFSRPLSVDEFVETAHTLGSTALPGEARVAQGSR